MSKMIRSALFSVIIGLSLFATQSFAQEDEGSGGDKEELQIFLLMGQSNMEGASSIDGAMDTEKDPRIFKLTDLGWVEACDPITNNASVAVGPAFAFAKKLVAEDENIKIGLVPLAVGGTHIAEWMKGGRFYGPTLNAVAMAKQQAAAMGYEGVVKAILWHQGEHDGILPSTATIYDENLETLVDDLRVDLGDPGLPFIVGGLARGILTNPRHVYANMVWSRLHWVATHFYRMGYVASADVPYRDDNLHFTSDGQRIMGERYADVYLKLSGHWREIGKQMLDATATDEGDGWKWSDQFGLYYDADFPFVKHAQLGWVKVDVFADMTLSIDSPVFGHFRTRSDSEESDKLYIYRESIYPEYANEYEEYGDPYLVDLLADSTANDVFYNLTTEQYEHTIENSSDFDQVDELNHQAEAEFDKALQAVADMSYDMAVGTTWSEMTRLLKETELRRQYTLIYATETYRFANRNLTGNSQNFWKEYSLGLMDRINPVLLSAQELWISYTISLYSF